MFTCATTRNVHLELTPSMDAADVIKALERFLSRRGCIKMFVSDNFSTFKSDDVKKYLLLRNLEWQYILSLSPWWGGFYERLVRTIKSTLRKVLGQAKLKFEELYTILTQVECVMNSRPISYIYAEENNKPITPSHLLLGRSLQGNLFQDVTLDKNIMLNVEQCHKRYTHLQKVINDYWKRFTSEYLSELREQQMHNYKKYSDAERLVINDMVLIKDDDMTPRNRWRKGVIDELIKGKDGKVRGATLRVFTKEGRINLIQRDIKRLIPLELNIKYEAEEPRRRTAAANADIIRRLSDM